jgi:hypothetical protein
VLAAARTSATASSGTAHAVGRGCSRSWPGNPDRALVPITRTSHSPSPVSTLPANTSRNQPRSVGQLAPVEAARGQRLRVEVDAQLRLAQAERQHLVDAGNALQVVAHAARGARRFSSSAWPVSSTIAVGKAVGGGDLEDLRVDRLGRQLGVGLVLDLAAQVVDALVEHALVDVAEAHQDVDTPSREELITQRTSCTLRSRPPAAW